jgi:cyclic pyranopterin phosphate synthase
MNRVRNFGFRIPDFGFSSLPQHDRVNPIRKTAFFSNGVNVDYLRVSVTDRCNLRCIYCNPFGNNRLIEEQEILSFEEIHRVVRLCAECGIKRVRLTGGEPLIRKNIVRLVRELAGIQGIEDLSMTTNGVLLEQVAAQLKEAGLKRVNISLNSLEHPCYRQMTGSDVLSRVIDGMYKAIEVGLAPVRINCVVIRDINLSQVPALAKMSIKLPVSVRFIEYCPTDKYTGLASDSVPNSEVRSTIESRLGPLSGVVLPNASGPAVYFKLEGSAGTIGFISGRSSAFCHRCNRLRLTSDGKIMPCLYSAHCYDLKKLLRNRSSDQTIVTLIRKSIRRKNRWTRLTVAAGNFSMQNIGG